MHPAILCIEADTQQGPYCMLPLQAKNEAVPIPVHLSASQEEYDLQLDHAAADFVKRTGGLLPHRAHALERKGMPVDVRMCQSQYCGNCKRAACPRRCSMGACCYSCATLSIMKPTAGRHTSGTQTIHCVTAGKRVKVLLVTNPDNPTGKVYSREQLSQMLSWCLENGVHYIRCAADRSWDTSAQADLLNSPLEAAARLLCISHFSCCQAGGQSPASCIYLAAPVRQTA